MRVLGALMQSKTRDRSLSLFAQRRAIEKWADMNGHEIVKFTADPSTSGKLDAFVRPELGPYLTSPAYIASWDIVVTLRLDRACRSTLNFLEVMKWCQERGKVFVSLRENIDMSTAQGRQAARDAASRAEWEHDMISERAKEARAEMNEQGRWPGGRLPWGYRAEERKEGYYLMTDEGGTADIARRMAHDAINGKSNRQIAKWLNDEGIRTNLGKTWLVETVRQVLWSDNMRGLLSEGDYAALRASLRTRKRARGQWTSGEHMFLRVAFCMHCSDETCAVPLYGRKRSDRPDRYYCAKCNTSVRKDWLEREVETELLARWGSQPYKVPHVVPGDDRAAEIKLLEHHLAIVKDVPMVDTSELEAKLDEMRAAPHEPDRFTLKLTGKTIAQHWKELESDQERNEFLRSNKVCVWAGIAKSGIRAGKPVYVLENTFLATMAGWQLERSIA